jgi:hypothetical protein
MVPGNLIFIRQALIEGRNISVVEAEEPLNVGAALSFEVLLALVGVVDHCNDTHAICNIKFSLA